MGRPLTAIVGYGVVNASARNMGGQRAAKSILGY